MKKLVIGLTCTLLLSSASVWAAPSVSGSTGLINSPTADVLRGGQFSLGYYHVQGGRTGTFTANILPSLELSMADSRYDGQQNKNYINVKFALVPEAVLTPGLAIGIEDIDSRDKRSVYAVASKALPFGFRVHAGAGNGRFKGVFAAIEKNINPLGSLNRNGVFPATTLIAEYDGETMNYGARVSILTGLKVDAGVRNHNSYIGVSFTN